MRWGSVGANAMDQRRYISVLVASDGKHAHSLFAGNWRYSEARETAKVRDGYRPAGRDGDGDKISGDMDEVSGAKTSGRLVEV